MHFSQQGENEVSEVAECQQHHYSSKSPGWNILMVGTSLAIARYGTDCHVSNFSALLSGLVCCSLHLFLHISARSPV